MRFHSVALVGLLTPKQRHFVEKIGKININEDGVSSPDNMTSDEKGGPEAQKLL